MRSLRSTTRLAQHTRVLTSQLEPDVSAMSHPFAQSAGAAHALSLGWSPLTVRTTSPDGAPTMTLPASARTLTPFQRPG